MPTNRSLSLALLVALALAPAAIAQDPHPRSAPPASSEPAGTPPALPEWGTSSLTWVQVAATAFLPQSSADGYTTELNGRGRRWGTSAGAGTYFQAPIELPQGAKIMMLGVFYLDNDPGDAVYGQLVNCAFSGPPCTTYPDPGIGNADCLVDGWVCSGSAFASTSGTGIYASLNAANVTVDNLNRRYYLNVFVPGSTGLARIGGAVVAYRLQVSPAPVDATFPNDVPTSHPYFQFIEALAAAGITGGCGPGSYCPNSPITRGEMAVFLAVALGLHWSPMLF